MRFNQPDPNYPPELLAKLQIDAFLEKYGKHKSCLAFVEYFKTTWAHRPGRIRAGHAPCLVGIQERQ
jgi:hypothetical protein